MTNKEIDQIIGWCRSRLIAKHWGLSGKRLEGYEEAMKQVMSYLHSLKMEEK